MDNQRSELNLYNPLFPLDYFPCRVNRVVVTARMMAQGGCAGGAFDPVSNIAWIPVGNSARDRAIRRHEASHANLPPITDIKMTALFQAVEDMRIHVLGQDTHNNQSRRDELVFALVDMRDSVRLILPKLDSFSPTMQRTNLIPVVRAAAILHYGVTNRRGCESKSPETRVANMVAKVLAAYEKCYKLTGLQAAIDKAVTALEHDDVVKATNIMRPFLTLAKDKDANLPQQKGGDSKQKPQKQDKKQDKKDKSPSGQLSADDDEEKEEQDKKEQKSKPAKKDKKDKKESDKSDKKESKNKSDESDDEAEEESKDDPSEDGDSGSGDDESDEEEESDESESGDTGDDESDEESDEDGDGDANAEGESGDDAQGGDDVPMSAEEAAPTGEKGGIGGCGDQLQDAIEDNRITAESVALLDPETIKQILALGRIGVPRMKVRQLEYRMSKRITQGLDYKLSHSGSRINVSRIPRIFDPKPGKIFERVDEQKGGTVLIDASGSMNLDNERLAKLAETIPVGQIAYYSGSYGGYGTLVIYSKAGRSYKLNTGERLPEVFGNNVIDFQAMQWLLKQPAPRWFVSDCQFCSSATTDAAEQLAARAYERKLITFHCTLGELEIEMHQRIELDQHDKQMVERSGGKKLLKKLSPCPVCDGTGGILNPEGGYWPTGEYSKSCGACNGKGHRKLQ